MKCLMLMFNAINAHGISFLLVYLPQSNATAVCSPALLEVKAPIIKLKTVFWTSLLRHEQKL